jgi:Predicted alternative thymidylate synthase
MILEYFTIEDFKDTFPLASFGARVCYSDGDLNYLLSDPRIIDKERRAEFLSKLGNSKHFSVFSHSFTYKRIGENNALKIGATYFKSRYNPKYPDVVGISLRHYLEELYKTDKYKDVFKQLAEYDTSITPIETYSQENITVSLLHLNTLYDGYAVFYIDGISRIATHQLVRHSALNFSQRSQRYVKENDNFTIIPSSISSCAEAKKLFKMVDELSQGVYNILVDTYKVKREDARFILPSGRNTTIVVSGTLNWIYDFLEKRTDTHAQWEIRYIANMMKNLLDKHITL